MNNKHFKSGFVAIIGRPNAGKSTMLNALLGSKISIVSPIPQTTRHRIKGILNLKNAQVVFVDTPGIHSFKDSLASQLNTVARQSIEGCDLLIYVADTSRAFGKEESDIMYFLSKQSIKIIMVLNKIDLGKKFMGEYMECWQRILKERNIEKDPITYYSPISAKTGQNIAELRDTIVESLPEQVPFYDKETSTDFPLKFRVADIVREKLFLVLKNELPHSLAVEVEAIKDMEGKIKEKDIKRTDIGFLKEIAEKDPEEDKQDAAGPQDEEAEEEETERDPSDLLFALSVPKGQLKKAGFIYIKVNIYVNRASQKKIVVGVGGKLLKEIGSTARQEIETIFGKKVYLQLWVQVLADWQNKPRILKELGYSTE
ncbi:MAG: GTPase Era [Candidatus Omnitrophota bacterium]|jgi:GTP-binding protein Era